MPSNPKIFTARSSYSYNYHSRRSTILILCFLIGFAGFVFGFIAISRRGLGNSCKYAEPRSVSVAWDRNVMEEENGFGVSDGGYKRHKVMGFVGIQTGFGSVARRRSLRQTWFPSDHNGLQNEEEARMKIYSVSTRHYYAFGALVSEELSYKLKELPKVRWVLPDSYLDVKNKDYGGEPFINGQAVPYDPKYHEEWVRNNARANERNRRNDRPRNFDRSRNFERRREMQNPGSNMGGGPPNMRNVPPPNMGGMQQQPNMGGMQQQPNMGGMHQPGMGGPPNMQPNMGGPQQPNMGGAPHNYGGGPPNNYGGAPNNPTNFQYNGGPANGGMPYQTGPGPNQNYASNTSGGNHYQNPNMPPPNQNYAPNTSGGNPHLNQNVPGRDPNYR